VAGQLIATPEINSGRARGRTPTDLRGNAACSGTSFVTCGHYSPLLADSEGHRRAGRDRSTSGPSCAALPATHADPSPPSGSAWDEPGITRERRSPGRPPEPVSGSVSRPAGAPRVGRALRACGAAYVAGGCEPVGTPVQLGTGPQSMKRGRKSENGMMACIPCPPVRMTISADWSPFSWRNTIHFPLGE
jgi:hypothetical protein